MKSYFFNKFRFAKGNVFNFLINKNNQNTISNRNNDIDDIISDCNSECELINSKTFIHYSERNNQITIESAIQSAINSPIVSMIESTIESPIKSKSKPVTVNGCSDGRAELLSGAEHATSHEILVDAGYHITPYQTIQEALLAGNSHT